jgi:nitroreductase
MGVYAQTLLLAMTSRGIASCAQGALGEYPDIVRRHLGLGIAERLMFGISFGYEDPAVKANAARVGRAPLEGRMGRWTCGPRSVRRTAAGMCRCGVRT